MVTDSLRYWALEMHVDGFRFDLATILAREPWSFDEGGGFLQSCRQDPVLSMTKLIAEHWYIGPGGYQVGRFPPGWAEWNDRFRDVARSYWKGDEGKVPEVISQEAPNAKLVLYPDAGHGFLFQYINDFAGEIERFLSA